MCVNDLEPLPNYGAQSLGNKRSMHGDHLVEVLSHGSTCHGACDLITMHAINHD